MEGPPTIFDSLSPFRSYEIYLPVGPTIKTVDDIIITRKEVIRFEARHTATDAAIEPDENTTATVPTVQVKTVSTTGTGPRTRIWKIIVPWVLSTWDSQGRKPTAQEVLNHLKATRNAVKTHTLIDRFEGNDTIWITGHGKEKTLTFKQLSTGLAGIKKDA